MDLLLLDCYISIRSGNFIELALYINMFPIVPIYNLLEFAAYDQFEEPLLLIMYVLWKYPHMDETLTLDAQKIINYRNRYHIEMISDSYLIDSDLSDKALLYLESLYQRESWVVNLLLQENVKN